MLNCDQSGSFNRSLDNNLNMANNFIIADLKLMELVLIKQIKENLLH